MAAPKGGTKARILNAAESLFASKGIDGTSTRAIVSKSGDTVGSLAYHFGSKENLIAEVIVRRWETMTEDRRRAYREAVAVSAPEPPSLETTVSCIVVPYLERAMNGDRGWRNYAMLIVRLLNADKRTQRRFEPLMTPASQEFIGWLIAAIPHGKLEDIGYAYEFMVGSMIEACAEATHNRLNKLTDGTCDPSNFDAVSPRLVRFIVGGIESVVEGGRGG
ncbi:TetR/AcrR family transcriptional regulator [Kineobactrum salinum]|uniref:TetR/AcrR family transcriptional regulator n=1 Tax=Kineobactrum salinum TaxID=2708301 RepID=A0A6C0TZG2_9GAMM|nr:TetR/AcrR family transcriptional regulator [Kineobactrum salinum]QIB64923.1 TetR/AcrR family transcriptional regulator [Kineobactrum salinum]